MIVSCLYRFWWFLVDNIKKYSHIKIWIRTYKEVLKKPGSLSDYVKKQNNFSHNNKKNNAFAHSNTTDRNSQNRKAPSHRQNNNTQYNINSQMLKGKFTQTWKWHYVFTLTPFRINTFEKCPSVCLFVEVNAHQYCFCLPTFLKMYICIFYRRTTNVWKNIGMNKWQKFHF